jgi:hypothetical protein
VHFVEVQSNPCAKDTDFKYREVPAGEQFRKDFIKEIIEVKNSSLEVIGFTMEKLDEIPSLLFLGTVFPEIFCSVPN